MGHKKERCYKKENLPEVREKVHMKVKISQNFTTIVTGHGIIKSCL